MVVVVFGVELRAVNEAHRRLKPFMKRRCTLQRCRRRRESIDELRAPRAKFNDRVTQRPRLMACGRALKPGRRCRGVHRSTLAEVFEPLLPELFDIREMPDVLSDRPFAIDLMMSCCVADALEQDVKSRHQAAQSFNEVGQHPWRMDKGKAALRPGNPGELTAVVNLTESSCRSHGLRLANAARRRPSERRAKARRGNST